MYVQLWSEANSYQDEEVMVLLKQSENVVAVESPAYFRAYHPVLEALKNLELDRVHFRSAIAINVIMISIMSYECDLSY